MDQQNLVEALKEVMKGDSEEAPLLVRRIPFICADIAEIKRHSDQTMTWVRGGVVAVLGAIVSFAVAWGSLQNQTMNNTKAIDRLQPEAIQSAIQQGTKDALKDIIVQLQEQQKK